MKSFIRILALFIAIFCCFALFSCDNDNEKNTDTSKPQENEPPAINVVFTVTEEEWINAFNQKNYTMYVKDNYWLWILGGQQIPGLTDAELSVKYTSDAVCYCEQDETVSNGVKIEGCSTDVSAENSQSPDSSEGLIQIATESCKVIHNGKWYVKMITTTTFWTETEDPHRVIPCVYGELTYDESNKAYVHYDRENNIKSFYYFENGVLVKQIDIIGNKDMTEDKSEYADLTYVSSDATYAEEYYTVIYIYDNYGTTTVTSHHDISSENIGLYQ